MSHFLSFKSRELKTIIDEFLARIPADPLTLLTKACDALSTQSNNIESSVQQLNMIAKTMQALEPRDEVEGQLLAQLVVLHEQAMSWLGRALRTERVDFANTYLNGASKLITRHHETLSALLKYCRGGEQRVHVEHVHVHNGGRAAVEPL